ncbi:MAG TPA: arabinofuranosidase catalytic domain-containing protein [Verrucomicrobiae bacterium]|nr:arabinofuranosidase catalytic domain-containing protein [Verrucomicrobiae bacterium]
MKTKTGLAILLTLALAFPLAALIIAAQAEAGRKASAARPEGPGDTYAAAGTPCVAAHSTTRALYAAYNGPLYQVMRQSDGKTLDIGVVQSSTTDAGGYANAIAQDAFCANTYCWITTIYDQSGHGNHLVQAPRGGFSGPAMGGFNNLPLADMAPITIRGHKVYGVFIEPGMGLRWNDAKGTAVEDQAEGQYWVISGHHYNSGCCFDYGNAETDSRDDGNGTMETAYYGNANAWYRGEPPGPWVMTDQENNLVGCVNPDGSKFCTNLPSITWRFVTATADGEPHHWRSMGGDAQQGDLKVMFDGPRVNGTYDPMRKQGAILLGNGGDNSNGSQGTFYEGAMTAAGTFPTKETNQKVQANVVAAKYDVQRLSLVPANATAIPPGLQTFSPGSSRESIVTFKNTTGAPAAGVKLSISVPTGWTSVVSGTTETSKTFTDPVAPGAGVSATFKVTSGSAAFNGDVVGNASWAANGLTQSETVAEKVRNISPIKINEFRISADSPSNSTDSFIELYNAGDSDVDISNWTLTQHPTQQPIFSSVKIPAGTKLAAQGFYLLGLANSGLAVPAHKGDTNLFVRSTTGMNVGDTIEIDNGAGMETRKLASLGTPAGNTTTVWQPLPDGPLLTIPVGSTNVPFTGSRGGFGGGGSFAIEVGEKIGLGYGATYPTVAKAVEKYEVVTVTAVGKPGTQAWLAADAKAGDTNIKVSSVANISVGDKIRLDIDSVGHGIETVTVTKVGTQSAFNPNNVRSGDPGSGLDLVEPLKFNHSANIPFSVRGTGISFQPATAFAHLSNEPIQPLGTGITLDSPLANDHEMDAIIRDGAVSTAGYQGPPSPDWWFGGPAFSNAGSMVLRDAAGFVVDSLNYGGLVDPWAAEGYQAESGAGRGGCSAPAPGGIRGGFGGRVGPAIGMLNRSAGRFPDGADTDSNCRDFLLQAATVLAADAMAEANNIKVVSVADFSAGQTVIIDAGENRETAVIATVGTAGATTVRTNTAVGVAVIPVANASGFSPGQTITIDIGANRESAVVASVSGGFRGFGGRRGGAGATITVAAPLTRAHEVDAEVAGSGITLTTGLTRPHASGTPIAGNLPTPGAPNQYARRTQ